MIRGILLYFKWHFAPSSGFSLFLTIVISWIHILISSHASNNVINKKLELLKCYFIFVLI